MILEATVSNDPGLIVKKTIRKLTGDRAKLVFAAATIAGGEIQRVIFEDLPGGRGDLARSYLPPRFLSKGTVIKAGAISDLVYARILDVGTVGKGGTMPDIVGKTVEHLAIPLTPQARNKWPRDWSRGDLTLIKSKAGNLILAEIRAASMVPQYVLKESVAIRPRHYLDKAAKRADPKVQAMLDKASKKAVDDGEGK